MTRKKITVSASVLKWARVTRFGARKEEAAKRLKVTIQELDNWETINPTISTAVLKKISIVYKRHISVLMLKTPPVSQEPPKFRTLINFEGLSFDQKTFLAIRQAQEIQATTSYLLDEKENQSLKELTKSSSTVETLVNKISDLLKINDISRFQTKNSKEQLVFWKRAIESLGIIVLQQSFPVNDIRAFTIYDKSAPVIMLNSRDTDNARIFSLFHELGHLALRQTDSDSAFSLNIEPRKKDEFFCNNFAASFLVPTGLLRKITSGINGYDDSSVKELADKFKVSKSVIWRKLRDSSIISQSEFNAIKRQLDYFEAYSTNKKVPKKGGGKNTYLYTVMNTRGEFYLSEVFDAYSSRKISYFEVLDYIGIKANNLPKLQKLMFT